MLRLSEMIEWVEMEGHEPEHSTWPSNADVEQADQGQVPYPPRIRAERLYELMLGMAVIYGVALFLIWQQIDQRVATLKGEMDAMRDELSHSIGTEERTNIAPFPDRYGPIVEEEGATRRYRFETDTLHFDASAQTITVVHSLAALCEAKHERLRRDFGLQTAPAHKLQILVDPAPESPHRSDDMLVVPSPDDIAAQQGITGVDALTNEIFAGLAAHVLNEAVNEREIRPQWRIMTRALHTYLVRAHGHNRNWRLDPEHLAQRHLAQNQSIDQVLHVSQERALADNAGVADTLVEYMLDAHGYAIVPALLDAFERFDTWQEMAPATFGQSAVDLETQWHTYLRDKYPLPDE